MRRDDNHFNDIEAGTFKQILTRVYTNGHEVSPRGMLIKELNNFTYKLRPYVRFMSFTGRKLNIDYIKREFLWYLKGDRYDTSIGEHAKMWVGLVNEDGSINSNYGQYIFGDQQQFLRAKTELIKDKDSRRASIVILSNTHLDSDTKDIPCTYALNFRIRQDKLHMSVHMRSQDAIFGMGNDAPAFSFVHEMMWQALRETYPELKYGDYFHIADSFHVYERHFEMMKTIVDGKDEFIKVDCPPISGPAEVNYLMYGDHLHTVHEEVPAEFLFTKWLHTY